MKRTVCVVTGSRAEYGLLRPLLDEVRNDAHLVLQLVATGSHLSPEFGLTFREIERDGFDITEKLEILTSSDTVTGTTKAMGLAMIGFGELYARLNPDIVVVLGDRFEIFSAVASACVSRKPVAHLHGGEVTEAAFDDAFRHSITKMSLLHFAACEEYRQRIIQLGEEPARVFNVGAIGVDNIRTLKPRTKGELEKDFGFTFGQKNLLVTFHPVTLEGDSELHLIELLRALDTLKDTKIIFTKGNPDPVGRRLNSIIGNYVARNRQRTVLVDSLGQRNYLSVMGYVDGVVGNSSSGIIEAPSFKIGTVNIGDRQKGRVRAESVIDCPAEEQQITVALKKLYSPQFKKVLARVSNPYGDGTASKKIVRILKRFKLQGAAKKAFYDSFPSGRDNKHG